MNLYFDFWSIHFLVYLCLFILLNVSYWLVCLCWFIKSVGIISEFKLTLCHISLYIHQLVSFRNHAYISMSNHNWVHIGIFMLNLWCWMTCCKLKVWPRIFFPSLSADNFEQVFRSIEYLKSSGLTALSTILSYMQIDSSRLGIAILDTTSHLIRIQKIAGSSWT